MINLGLDASTTTVGICYSENNNILYANFLDISNKPTNKDKAFHLINFLDSLPYKFDNIILETPLCNFRFGRTSQQTIIKLIKFNAILEYILSENYKINIILINATTARKYLFGKARLKGVKSKDYVKMYLEKMFDLSSFLIKTKKNKDDKRMTDVYDAIVLSFYKNKSLQK